MERNAHRVRQELYTCKLESAQEAGAREVRMEQDREPKASVSMGRRSPTRCTTLQGILLKKLCGRMNWEIVD